MGNASSDFMSFMNSGATRKDVARELGFSSVKEMKATGQPMHDLWNERKSMAKRDGWTSQSAKISDDRFFAKVRAGSAKKVDFSSKAMSRDAAKVTPRMPELSNAGRTLSVEGEANAAGVAAYEKHLASNRGDIIGANYMAAEARSAKLNLARAASLRQSTGGGVGDQPRVPAGNPDGGQFTKG